MKCYKKVFNWRREIHELRPMPEFRIIEISLKEYGSSLRVELLQENTVIIYEETPSDKKVNHLVNSLIVVRNRKTLHTYP